MKTLQDLIDHFANEPEIQGLLKTNLQGVPLHGTYETFSSVLLTSFVWKQAPEGSNYWNNVYVKLLEEEATTQQP